MAKIGVPLRKLNLRGFKPLKKGGKDLQSRNGAIELMKVKTSGLYQA